MKTSPIKYFDTAAELTCLINSYFASVGIQSNAAPKTLKSKSFQKFAAANNKPVVALPIEPLPVAKHDPPTLSDLALFLGFNGLDELETYAKTGRYASHLRRARLLIAAVYEKKLHNTNASGAIFMLKSMGYGQEKPREKPIEKPNAKIPTTLQVEIIESGPKPAASEKEVVLT